MARQKYSSSTKALHDFSEKQLRREIARRERLRMVDLRNERARYMKEVARIDRELGVKKPGQGITIAPPKDAGAQRAGKRASRAEMASLANRIQKAVQEEPKGQSIVEIRKKVRAKPLQIRHVMRKLISDGKVKTVGERRSTRYFPG